MRMVIYTRSEIANDIDKNVKPYKRTYFNCKCFSSSLLKEDFNIFKSLLF